MALPCAGPVAFDIVFEKSCLGMAVVIIVLFASARAMARFALRIFRIEARTLEAEEGADAPGLLHSLSFDPPAACAEDCGMLSFTKGLGFKMSFQVVPNSSRTPPVQR